MMRWVVIVAGLLACTPEPEPELTSSNAAAEPEPMPKAASTASQRAETMLAVVVPRYEVDLVPLNFGRLRTVEVGVGDRVAKGTVVAQMDSAPAEREHSAARAARRVAKAELERSSVELSHAKQSRQDLEKIGDFVAKDELRDRARDSKVRAAGRRRAAAALAEADQGVAQSGARITDGALTAPFDGYVSRRYVDAGATIAPGEGVVRLLSQERLIRFALRGDQRAQLEVGATVTVEFPGHAQSYRAQVSAIEPEIDAGTRLILVEAMLDVGPETYADLSPGTRGQVTLAHGSNASNGGTRETGAR